MFIHISYHFYCSPSESPSGTIDLKSVRDISAYDKNGE